MIPIDPSGTQQHMAVMHREPIPLATASRQMADKPGMGMSAQRSVGTLDPQATRSAGDCSALRRAHDLTMQERVRRLTEARDASAEERVTALMEAHDGEGAPPPEGQVACDEGPALDRFFRFGARTGDAIAHHGCEFLRHNMDAQVHTMDSIAHQDAMVARSEGSRLQASAIQRHGELASR